MKAKGMFLTLALLLSTVTPAFAASTHRVYNSGILVLLFVGFCALVVVIQLIPAIMTLVGMLKGAAKTAKESQAAEVKVTE
jgi:hypothetical protein